MTRKHVIQEQAIEWQKADHDERFGHSFKALGKSAGSRKLGCRMCRLEPGKRAWPFHAHLNIEEAIYVLSGTGCLRLGEQEHAVKQGAYIALPPDPKLPHQLINNGTEILTYLCFSTMDDPDVVLYPDSDKVGVMAGFPNGEKTELTFGGFFRQGDTVNYWLDEDDKQHDD